MIRLCGPDDFDRVLAIINDGALAYRGVIPPDRWTTPYMPAEELRNELEQGVVMWGYEEEGMLVGVMGIRSAGDVVLIRHAYVLTIRQRQGIGGRLLARLRQGVDLPMLVGTWAAASWAVSFYQRHGFRLVTAEEKDRLLRRYWSIPERQVETSVVLADARWFASRGSR
ncbi:MAG TPA: GNAT family N-acetyltransferase [Actinomycetota bacterium]